MRPGIFNEKNFSLDSLTKDFEFHFRFLKVFDYATKLQKIYFSQVLDGLTGLTKNSVTMAGLIAGLEAV